MFFLLSKILNFLVEPITWFFALFVWALLCKKPGRQKKLFITFGVALYFFCNSFISDLASNAWEIPGRDENKLECYDAGIVLSGMMSYDYNLHKYQFMHGVDRLLQALELYKKGKIKKIVFTGGSGSLTYTYIKEGMLVRNYLLRLGIPDKDLIIETESNNTRENALFTKPLLEKNFPNGKFLLITSGYHMRRSLACFQKIGIAVTPYSTDRLGGKPKFVFDHLLLPNLHALETWQVIIHEMTGLVMYKVAGYG